MTTSHWVWSWDSWGAHGPGPARVLAFLRSADPLKLRGVARGQGAGLRVGVLCSPWMGLSPPGIFRRQGHLPPLSGWLPCLSALEHTRPCLGALRTPESDAARQAPWCARSVGTGGAPWELAERVRTSGTGRANGALVLRFCALRAASPVPELRARSDTVRQVWRGRGRAPPRVH